MKKLFPFDECYLINLVERPDRFEYMTNQFKSLKCENEIIIHRVVKHPDWIMEKIYSEINSSKNMKIDTPHAISCQREHYTLIKSAYLRGLESVMIIEDDCGFIKDRSILEEYFNNLPDDWDVLRINCLRGSKTQEYINKYKDKYKYWFPQTTRIYGAAAYALSRKGMKYILDWYEEKYDAFDVPFYLNESKIKYYIPAIPLGLCKEINLKSDLHQHVVNDSTNYYGYTLYRLYKQTDNQNDYF